MAGTRPKLAAVALGAIAACVLAEALVRSLGLAPAPPSSVDRELAFHVLRADPSIGYSLRPNARGQFQNAAVSINEIGCRDDAVRPNPGVRILALGDSIAFGASVDQHATWEARLDQGLGPDVDVINCGVSGYNLLQMQARYADGLAALAPDIVLLHVFSDDLAPPYGLQGSGVRDVLRARSEAFRVAELGWMALRGGDGRAAQGWFLDGEDYRDRAMARTRGWLDARRTEGLRVLLVVHPMLVPVERNWEATRSDLRAFVESLPTPSLYLEPLYADATDGELQRLSIAPDTRDPHPNIAGQELMALAIWDRLHQLGWVDRAPETEAPPRRSTD